MRTHTHTHCHTHTHTHTHTHYRYQRKQGKHGLKLYVAHTTLQYAHTPIILTQTQRKHEEYGLQAYVAHATFQYSGTPGKRHRFREAMLFEDPPSYYDHPKGFIYVK